MINLIFAVSSLSHPKEVGKRLKKVKEEVKQVSN